MMNSSTMGLYFIKEVNGFKKEGEAGKPRQDQDNCKHSFLFSLPGIRQNGCPGWQLMHTILIYKAIGFRKPAPALAGTLSKWKTAYQNEKDWPVLRPRS